MDKKYQWKNSLLRRSYTGYRFAKKTLYRSNLARQNNNIGKKIEQPLAHILPVQPELGTY